MRAFITFIIVSFLLFHNCSIREKIGNYEYKVKYERVNTGDNSIVYYMKTYYFNNKFQAGCVIKSYKLGMESKRDTVFSNGYTEVDRYKLKCIESNHFPKKNENIKIFIQKDNGFLELIK